MPYTRAAEEEKGCAMLKRQRDRSLRGKRKSTAADMQISGEYANTCSRVATIMIGLGLGSFAKEKCRNNG